MSHANTSPGQSDPLALLDFSSLIDGAAKLRPSRIAFHDVEGGGARALTFEALNQRTSAMANAWQDLGLAAGERLLLCANGSAGSMVALFGALRAGLDVALAPPQMEGEELAQYAMAVGAAGMCGEAICGDIDVADAMFTAAARAERVRIVACIGTSSIDGAVPLDPFVLDLRKPVVEGGPELSLHARVITRDAGGQCVFHRQRTLVAAALDFITHTQIGTQIPIVSTILPASFAGLTAGPIAALAAGAPLVLHAPFDANKLAAQIAALRPVHLVVPAQLSEGIAASDLADATALASLVLLTRFRQMPADVAQESGEGSAYPVVDIYAIGEVAAIAEPRLADGARVAPLTLQHTLNLDGSDVVAARRKVHYLAANGRLDTVIAIEGAAVSQASEGENERS